ncbi:MAG TPA: tail fiber protein [Candidatus Udaeobacter sp.]|nr:tail fiber protein [Candidatus Udaeobacter sp.]
MDPYLGEIRMFAGNFAPQGWALCNGALLSISENDALFALLGTTYGGDGQTTFALPNLVSRVPIGQGTSPQTGTTYAAGQQGGTESVAISVNELPAHTHPVYASNAGGTQSSPNAAVWAAQTSRNIYSTALPEGQMNLQSITPTGGSQPHDNMMPFLPINFIIALTGIFPSQS